MNPEGKVDLSGLNVRATGVFQGRKKRNGVKTDQPLVDAATQRNVWWMPSKVYPVGSQGGEDVSPLIMVLCDDCPIDLQYGETPLVDLLEARVRIEDGRNTLVCSGVKRVVEAKASK